MLTTYVKATAAVSAALIVAVICGRLALSAQTPAPSTANDAVAALTAEVRALRADLTQLATASVRSQLLVTRVQLQEQRLIYLDRQRTEVAAKLVDAQKVGATFAAQLKRFESPGPETTAAQRRDIEGMLGTVKAQFDGAQATERTLRSELDTLMSEISAEQSRWTDFNSRLDQLERSLPSR